MAYFNGSIREWNLIIHALRDTADRRDLEAASCRETFPYASERLTLEARELRNIADDLENKK